MHEFVQSNECQLTDDDVVELLQPLTMGWQCPACWHVGMTSYRWFESYGYGVRLCRARECDGCGAQFGEEDLPR